MHCTNAIHLIRFLLEHIPAYENYMQAQTLSY